MQLNNAWAGLLGLVLGIALVIAFYGVFITLTESVDTEARFIIGVPLAMIIFFVGFMIPITLISEDDRGRQA